MRGFDERQNGLFGYVSLEARIPSTHPLRAVREIVDRALAGMLQEFEAIYATQRRPPQPTFLSGKIPDISTLV